MAARGECFILCVARSSLITHYAIYNLCINYARTGSNSSRYYVLVDEKYFITDDYFRQTHLGRHVLILVMNFPVCLDVIAAKHIIIVILTGFV